MRLQTANHPKQDSSRAPNRAGADPWTIVGKPAVDKEGSIKNAQKLAAKFELAFLASITRCACGPRGLACAFVLRCGTAQLCGGWTRTTSVAPAHPLRPPPPDPTPDRPSNHIAGRAIDVQITTSAPVQVALGPYCSWEGGSIECSLANCAARGWVPVLQSICRADNTCIIRGGLDSYVYTGATKIYAVACRHGLVKYLKPKDPKKKDDKPHFSVDGK